MSKDYDYIPPDNPHLHPLPDREMHEEEREDRCRRAERAIYEKVCLHHLGESPITRFVADAIARNCVNALRREGLL